MQTRCQQHQQHRVCAAEGQADHVSIFPSHGSVSFVSDNRILPAGSSGGCVICLFSMVKLKPAECPSRCHKSQTRCSSSPLRLKAYKMSLYVDAIKCMKTEALGPSCSMEQEVVASGCLSGLSDLRSSGHKHIALPGQDTTHEQFLMVSG